MLSLFEAVLKGFTFLFKAFFKFSYHFCLWPLLKEADRVIKSREGLAVEGPVFNKRMLQKTGSQGGLANL